MNKGEKIRICMDPADLNKNIKRRHYPLKTVEEIASRVKEGCKVFYKIGLSQGFLANTGNGTNIGLFDCCYTMGSLSIFKITIWNFIGTGSVFGNYECNIGWNQELRGGNG